jgi:hypothetical protein
MPAALSKSNPTAVSSSPTGRVLQHAMLIVSAISLLSDAIWRCRFLAPLMDEAQILFLLVAEKVFLSVVSSIDSDTACFYAS